MIALLDGDIFLYECGFSSDANARKDLLNKWHLFHGKNLNEEQQVEWDNAFEPLEYNLKIVKNKIAELIDITGADSFEIYLTGSNNYRLDILPQYKANRDPNRKPHWYKEIKEYLINVQGAVVCEGIEADDMLGIRQMAEFRKMHGVKETTEETDHTCICTKDKDLDCIPGFHYNWSPSRINDGVYNISEVEANRFFYTQCLTGDTTDNIPGLKKLTGQIATAKKKAALATMDSVYDMYTHVANLYGDTDFTASAKCLWIQRESGEIWEPPTQGVGNEATK